MATTFLIHSVLIDGFSAEPVENAWVRLDDDRITDVGSGSVTTGQAQVVDCAGRTVMPGLIDAHAHLAAVDYLDALTDSPRALYAARVFAEMRSTLEHGYTTVRDAGHTDAGFRRAVEDGMVPGPRMLVSNGPLSQTGGHADRRKTHGREPMVMFDGLVWMGVLADGVDQVRWAAREVLRCGADQVKVMASGGCASHGDEVTDTQFTLEELSAIVHEANARGRDVMAHAYNPESIANAVHAGVRSIEHGNLLDEPSARLMAETGTYLVPTIATFHLLARDGLEMGLDKHQVAQVREVLALAFTSLELAMESGVTIGSGSDVLGRHQSQKALALELQATVMGTMAALTAATATNAEIIRRGHDLGRVAPGYLADLLIVDGLPSEDISCLQNTDAIHSVLQAGRTVVDRRPESADANGSLA